MCENKTIRHSGSGHYHAIAGQARNDERGNFVELGGIVRFPPLAPWGEG